LLVADNEELRAAARGARAASEVLRAEVARLQSDVVAMIASPRDAVPQTLAG
jgi:hypothetical protein